MKTLLHYSYALLATLVLFASACHKKVQLEYPLSEADVSIYAHEAEVYLAKGVALRDVVEVSEFRGLWPRSTLREAKIALGSPLGTRRLADGVYTKFSQGLLLVETRELRETGRGEISRWELRACPPAVSFMHGLPKALQAFLESIDPHILRVAVLDDHDNSILLLFEGGSFKCMSMPLDSEHP
jgi:hypothetical protein